MNHRKLIGLISSTVLAGVAMAACGDGETNNPMGMGGADGTGGTTDRTLRTECRAVQELCDDQCTSVLTDSANCGECGNECADGEGCLLGECANFGCPTGQVACDELCVSIQTDEANCGGCGNNCAAGEMCLNGQCEPSCTDSQLVCDDACIDPMNDRDYCGADSCDFGAGGAGAGGASSGEACTSGTVCVGGDCVNSCPVGQLECGGKCIDPLTNNAYCGASDCSDVSTSGSACQGEEACVVGECRTFLRQWNTAESVSVDGWKTGTNESAMGVDDEGDVVVMFRQYETDTTVNPNFMYVNHFDAQTKSWSGPLRISTSSEDTTTNPALAVAANGDAVAAWTEVHGDGGQDVKLARYIKATNTWSDPETVDMGDGKAYGPAVTIDGQGKVHIAYIKDIDETATTVYRVRHHMAPSISGTLQSATTFSGFGEVVGSGSGAGFPVLSSNAAGDVALAFPQTSAAYDATSGAVATVFDADTNTWGTPQFVNDNYTPPSYEGTLGTQIGLTVDAAGNVYLAFNQYSFVSSNYDIHAIKYDADGGSWGTLQTVVDEATSVLRPDLVSTSTGDLAMVYRVKKASSVDVVVLRLNDSFGIVDTEVVDADLLGSGSFTGNNARPNAKVLIADDGAIHALWADGSRVLADDYDAQADTWTGAIELNSSMPAFSGTPNLAGSLSGQAYASWYGQGEFWVSRFD